MRIINKNFIIILLLAIYSCNFSAYGWAPPGGAEPEPRSVWWPIPIVPIITNVKQIIKNGGRMAGRFFIPLGVAGGIQDCRRLGVSGTVFNSLPVPYYSCDPDPAKGGFGCGLVDAVEAEGIRSSSLKIIRLPCGGVCVFRNPFAIFPYIVEKEQDFWGTFTEDPPIEQPEPPLPPIPPWQPPGKWPNEGWHPVR